MQLAELNQYLSQYLRPFEFNDYCPNGLQVEGKVKVNKIVTGVTASMELLTQAHAAKADAILVHHGYFWKNESQVVTGIKKHRLQFLLANEINLFAYHLPLDAHAEVGNNVMLGKQLGLAVAGFLDEKKMMPYTILDKPLSLKVLRKRISTALNREALLIGNEAKEVCKIAWCTGAAQHYLEQAINYDVDVFISGEISEQTVHLARESNTSYIAAGHHATERYGIQALGEHLAQKFNLEHDFIDVENPV